MYAHEDALHDLEHNFWSMYSVLGRGKGGAVIENDERLVTFAPIKQPPYNAVWRFYDDGSRPIAEQIDALVAEFDERAVAPIWTQHPSTPPEVRDVFAGKGWDRCSTSATRSTSPRRPTPTKATRG